MTAANTSTLEKHRHHWLTLRDAGYLRGLNYIEKDEILRVAREEFFGAGYSPDMWCGNCVAEFVRNVYIQFDKIMNYATNPV